MKEKSLFEQKGIGYTECDGVYIPNVVLPIRDEYQIGRFGLMHKRWLKENHISIYTAQIIKGELDKYLMDVDTRAKEMYNDLVTQLAEQEGVTEQLKATNMLEWVQAMNNISNRAIEIVYNEIIYSIN